MFVAVIIFGILAAACLGAGGYLYYEYARSPQKAWRERVLGQLKRARTAAAVEKARTRRLTEQQAAAEQAAHNQAVANLLRSISVDGLEAYPGIGPGTIGKLRSHGITDLARLRDLRTHIPGLGEKRSSDLAAAARDLARESMQRFEKGTSEEGKRHRAALTALQAEFETARLQADARARAAGSVAQELERLAPLAARVNVLRYHCLGGSRLVPDDVLGRPLPDLDAALQAASQPQPTRPADRPEARPPGAVPARPAAPPALPVDRHLIVMERTIEFAFAVGRAGGTMASFQRAILDRQLDERYGHDPALRNRARAFCAHYATAAIDVGKCLAQMSQVFEPAERAELICFATPLAAAADMEKARALLARAASELGVPIPAVEAVAPVSGSKSPTREDHLAALEIDASTPLSADLVRRQYHLLTDRYQPDKVQSLGPEFVALAERKRAAAEAAALALLQPLGESLEPPTPPRQELRHNPDLDDVFGV